MKAVQKHARRQMIRPLKTRPSTYERRRVIVFDVETTSSAHPKFVLAYALYHDGTKKYCRRKYHFFRTREGLTKFIMSKAKPKKALYVFAHNMTFDFSFLDHRLLFKTFRLTHVSIQPFIVKLSSPNHGTITFLDTMNFFKQSLEQLFPDEKVKVDFSSQPSISLLKKRCRKDVELTFRLVAKVGGVSASQWALKLFRSEARVHIQKITTPLAVKSYYGGRVECYVNHMPVENIKYYDFNSLFPTVMAENPMPIKYVQTIRNPSHEMVKTLLAKGFFLFAHVRVNVPEDERIPPFPLKHNGKLYFPVGEFDTFLASPEIVLGLEKGWIKKFYIIEQYYAKNVFKEFVEKYYRLRLQDEANSMFYKLVLNSLYGKFGQRRTKSKIVQLKEPYTGHMALLDGKEKASVYFIRGQGFAVKKLGEYEYIPAISSAIASYARVKLYKTMEKIKFNVVYTDTDSLFTPETLETGTGLGELKLKGVGTFVGFRAKAYVFGDSVKFKGARVNKTMLNPETFKVKVKVKNFSTLRQFIKDKVYRIVETEKVFDLKDDKREGFGFTRPKRACDILGSSVSLKAFQ